MLLDDGRVVSNFVAQVNLSHFVLLIYLGLLFYKLLTTLCSHQFDVNHNLKITQALRKVPLTVYGDGKQTRSFQYVSDLVINYSFLTFFFINGTSYQYHQVVYIDWTFSGNIILIL